MFDMANAFSSFAVDDVAAAQTFYRESLAVDVSVEAGLLTLHVGDREIIVYPKLDHSPASFTILNFPVDDIDRAVDDLVARGVRFERYPGFEHDARGIVRAEGGPPIAWFTDPAGNILSVLEDPSSLPGGEEG